MYVFKRMGFGSRVTNQSYGNNSDWMFSHAKVSFYFHFTAPNSRFTAPGNHFYYQLSLTLLNVVMSAMLTLSFEDTQMCL